MDPIVDASKVHIPKVVGFCRMNNLLANNLNVYLLLLWKSILVMKKFFVVIGIATKKRLYQEHIKDILIVQMLKDFVCMLK